MKDDRKFDLEERLINFAVLIVEIVESMPKTKAAGILSGQLVRCGTSSALNYGEAVENKGWPYFRVLHCKPLEFLNKTKSIKNLSHPLFKRTTRNVCLFKDNLSHKAIQIRRQNTLCTKRKQRTNRHICQKRRNSEKEFES